jgi:signal transduction histidine kinase
VHDYFKEIDSSGRILLYLMNSLLDLAKLESGKMRFNFEETNLNELISSAVSEFSLICSERGLSIQVVESSENVECVIDPEKIKQVMRNILANAVRFSPDGGEIEVYLTRNNELVTVSVGDQGMGIPPEELDGIFEKFVQSSKTNTGAGGTGLGLSISREIILKHKGRIWAENRSPNGALFIFELLQNLKIFTATETQILRRKDGPVPKRI